MAFSTSFFTPDLSPATGGSQPQETRATMDGAQNNNGHQNIDGQIQPVNGQVTEPTPSMPHPQRSQQVPTGDGTDREMNGDLSSVGNSATPAPKAVASKKKKGTASTVKAPSKRARPNTGGGGAKKAKGGGTKKAKADASSKQPSAAQTVADVGNTSESDNGPYCLCRGPDDHRFMIACDRCEDWFHGECIGMDKHTGENLVQKYICPNCTDGGRYTTRYKKMCSLPGCNNPARIYDSARPSIFCSSEHCQAWWEQLISTLPRTKNAADADYLTQEEFMGLLDTPPSSSSPDDNLTTPWKLGHRPFETPPNFWDLPFSSSALTPEERTLLTTSATARYQLGEEIVLCKKMLQLIDMALKRREAAIAAGKGTAKDLCGYDYRLDSVGATHQFARFLQSPQGEAIFTTGRLDGPDTPSVTTSTTITNSNNNNSNSAEETGGGGSEADPQLTNMCTKKKCKPHNGWSNILTKSVRHDMKELAAQAKELLDAEQRVRDGAAGRFRRRLKERNAVMTLFCGSEKDGGEGMDVDT
ncbi:Set1 complex component spp1 [Achaetomium macrosporum]|uniref:Set1 complex component spp1 n=1 Tax=Achaetomium macrosporum TaxID=79813 RepID=A0AAN7C9F4_9PEZI|nr:Set1 complex component spp1 [Achaetomium macrosporum]